MTDKALYQHVRQLVRAQKENNMNVENSNFAEQYCKNELMKKRKVKPNESSRMTNVLKNFKNVDSYINVLDIIKKMPEIFQKDETEEQPISHEATRTIVPETLQSKIKECLGPILNKRYQDEGEQRQQIMQTIAKQICLTSSELDEEVRGQKVLTQALENGSETMEEIELLRRDIKRKPIYYIEQKFEKEMKDISIMPKRIENSRIFHKVCSYMQMVLEEQHQEKWASKKDKALREQHREENLRKKYRMPTKVRHAVETAVKITGNNSRSNSVRSSVRALIAQENPVVEGEDSGHLLAPPITKKSTFGAVPFEDNESEVSTPKEVHRAEEVPRKAVSRHDNFTFRKRGVKAGVIKKLNGFVETVAEEQRKNCEMSKKYGSALNSLSEEIKTSYRNFRHEEVADDQQIGEMRKYIDNTLSRNKRNLKKFHQHRP